MNIIIRHSLDNNWQSSVEVGALTYDIAEGLFTMPLCIGDDWNQRITCTSEVQPISIQTQGPQLIILLRNSDDAQQFENWLLESERRVQNGYHTMKG